MIFNTKLHTVTAIVLAVSSVSASHNNQRDIYSDQEVANWIDEYLDKAAIPAYDNQKNHQQKQYQYSSPAPYQHKTTKPSSDEECDEDKKHQTHATRTNAYHQPAQYKAPYQYKPSSKYEDDEDYGYQGNHTTNSTTPDNSNSTKNDTKKYRTPEDSKEAADAASTAESLLKASGSALFLCMIFGFSAVLGL